MIGLRRRDESHLARGEGPAHGEAVPPGEGGERAAGSARSAGADASGRGAPRGAGGLVDLPHDPARRALILEGYGLGAVVGNFFASAVLTLLVTGVQALAPSLAPQPPASLLPAWLLLVVQPALMLWASARLGKGDVRAFERAFFLQSLSQYAWLGWLAYAGGWVFAAIASMAMAVWVLHDARHLDTAPLKVALLAAFPAADAAVLVGAVLTGGALPFGGEPAPLAAVVLVQVVLAAILVQVADVIATEARRAAELADDATRQASALAALRSEREVVARLARVLAGRVSDRRLRHDLAGPVQAIEVGSSELADVLAPHLDGLPPADRDDARGLLEDLALAAAQVRRLTDQLRQSDAAMTGARALPAVVRDAVEFAQGAVLATGRAVAPVHTRVDDVSVVADDEIGPVLGNLVHNALVRTADDVLLTSSCDGGTVRLSIRDRGVQGAEADAAVARIRARLELAGAAELGGSDGGGQFGLGLLLVRLHLARIGAFIEVARNTDGRGLTLTVTFRRAEGEEASVALEGSL